LRVFVPVALANLLTLLTPVLDLLGVG